MSISQPYKPFIFTNEFTASFSFHHGILINGTFSNFVTYRTRHVKHTINGMSPSYPPYVIEIERLRKFPYLGSPCQRRFPGRKMQTLLSRRRRVRVPNLPARESLGREREHVINSVVEKIYLILLWV